MKSWDDRNRQRGGYRQPQFLAKMQELGFAEVEPSPAPNHAFVLHEFTHPDTGDRRYRVKAGMSYAAAVREFTAVLEAAKPKTPCNSEDECTYQPFCGLNNQCMRLTAIGPIKRSRSLQQSKGTPS